MYDPSRTSTKSALEYWHAMSVVMTLVMVVVAVEEEAVDDGVG